MSAGLRTVETKTSTHSMSKGSGLVGSPGMSGTGKPKPTSSSLADSGKTVLTPTGGVSGGRTGGTTSTRVITTPTMSSGPKSGLEESKGDGSGSTGTATALAGPRSDRVRFTLADLTLGTTLGTGTFGRVRLARHKGSKKYMALKILKKSEIIRLKQVDHIKSEVVILSMLSHPFIVNMLGHYQDERRLYMLLEYVPGGELFSHLRQQGRFPEETAKFYTAQITLAFQHLHDHNVVYRDLKPENLLINKDGNIKITDFGFAKIVPDRTWTLCGTPEYLAPEIIQSKGHGKSVDWWALGILIFEMAAGYPPFFDETPYGIYQKILGGKIEFPRHFDVKVKDLIRRLLTADRSKRLGCLRGGAEDIKAHKWFARTDWDAVFRCAITPPFVPLVRGEDDTSNFDEYPDSDEDTALPLSSKDRARFSEFDTF